MVQHEIALDSYEEKVVKKIAALTIKTMHPKIAGVHSLSSCSHLTPEVLAAT